MQETCRPRSLGIAVFWLHSDELCWSCAVEHSVTFMAPLGFLPSIPGGSLCTQVEIKGFENTHLKWSWQSPALLVCPKSLWGNAVWWECHFGGFISPSCSLKDHFLTASFFLELETYLTEPCVGSAETALGSHYLDLKLMGASCTGFHKSLLLSCSFLPCCSWSVTASQVEMSPCRTNPPTLMHGFLP